MALGKGCSHHRLYYGNRTSGGLRCPDCGEVVDVHNDDGIPSFSRPPMVKEFEKEMSDPRKYVFCMSRSKTITWSKCEVGCNFPGCNKWISKPISL